MYAKYENELPKLANVISSTKLRNALRRQDNSLVIELKNIRINRQAQGCSGFVTDPNTQRTVYISTDVNHGTTTRALYRRARDNHDFTGERNHFCALDPKIIAESALELLNA